MKFLIYTRTRIKRNDSTKLFYFVRRAELELKPKHLTYLTKLIQLNGGASKPTNSKIFSNLINHFRKNIKEKVTDKLTEFIEKNFGELVSNLIIAILNEFGLEGLVALLTFEYILRSKRFDSIKIHLFMMSFTAKCFAYWDLLGKLKTCNKEIAFFIDAQNEEKNTLSLMKNFLLNRFVSLPNSNNISNFYLLLCQRRILQLSISVGLFIEIGSVVSPKFNTALADNSNLKIVLLKSFFALLVAVSGLNISESNQLENLTQRYSQQLFTGNSNKLLYFILISSPIGNLFQLSLPIKAETSNIRNPIFPPIDNQSPIPEKRIEIFDQNQGNSYKNPIEYVPTNDLYEISEFQSAVIPEDKVK